MAIFSGSVNDIENKQNRVTTIDSNSDDTHYPTAKAVKDYVDESGGGGGGGGDMTAYLKRDGTRAMTGDFDGGGHKIKNVSQVAAPSIIAQGFAVQSPFGTGTLEQYPSPNSIFLKSSIQASISSSSTDAQVPSAKCVYDIVGNIESVLETLVTVEE